MQEVVGYFEAVARFESQPLPTFIRIAQTGDANYIDLGDKSWDAVRVDNTGWKIVKRPAVKFRRAPGMLPLPKPVRGGSIRDLRPFLNFRSEDDWLLYVDDLLAAQNTPGPRPILGVHGEQGSAKTTACRIFKRLTDPNASELRAMPRDVRDLVIAARNCWVLAFDNLSFLPVWLSDAFCRLSTGGGFSTRQLYTDADEVIFDGQRPVLINGIDELASRADLLDRSILLELPPIRSYRDESAFWLEFEVARPRILGALLDAAVKIRQKLPTTELTDKPRMADFAIFGTAAETALNLPRGTFSEAYAANRKDANALALEASPIAAPTRELGVQGWEGSASKLLAKLAGMVDEKTVKQQGWPKTPKVLSGLLRRLAPAFRKSETLVEFYRENTAERTRMIRVYQADPQRTEKRGSRPSNLK